MALSVNGGLLDVNVGRASMLADLMLQYASPWELLVAVELVKMRLEKRRLMIENNDDLRQWLIDNDWLEEPE